MAAIPNSSVNVPQATGSGQCFWSVEVHRPTKRYIRAAVGRAGANAVINGGVVVMVRAGILPPAQGPNSGNVTPPILVSP
jgi:hypothetical protein